MPFELSATTHIFSKTPSGGLQRVIAKDPSDAGQIRLIQAHLESIAAQFRQGDYAGPTQTHGEQMAGLAKLKAATAGDISIRYESLANGGQIEYFAKTPELVAAIHDWFDAQVSDHGADAMAGHDHGLQH